MVVNFEVDRMFVTLHGGYVTVECHKQGRWIRITGPFSGMQGDVLQDVPCNVSVINKTVMASAVTADDDDGGGKWMIWFADPPEITGGWWEE